MVYQWFISKKNIIFQAFREVQHFPGGLGEGANFLQEEGGGGGEVIFSYIRRLGPFFLFKIFSEKLIFDRV